MFSSHYLLDPQELKKIGVLDPLLNVDTHLFIDSLLFKNSQHPEFCVAAIKTYELYFQKIIKLLAISKKENDLPWRNAERLFSFSEIKETCIGYGASSIHGSAWGPNLKLKIMRTAYEIVSLGIDDPELFILLALFEEGMGPDRISDMMTNIILKDLMAFNERILTLLGLTPLAVEIKGITGNLMPNPLETSASVILLPYDILRDLPIARDWDGVQIAAQQNESLRNRVNQQIGTIWEKSSRDTKSKLKAEVLSNKQNFLTLIETFQNTEKKPYDAISDPNGEIVWTSYLDKEKLAEYPLVLNLSSSPTIDEVFQIVHKIVEQFILLVENKGLWKDLWIGGKPRPEKAAQRLFLQ